MWKKFEDVLDIINGKNQKKVENPNGIYPIYGSGGVMGYADDYLCEANTVVIGRKGSINNPIYVEEPFWNVDTAFGLVARKNVLLPKYLYLFCVNYDFNKLNTTVTIPSLTKANLLKIEIDVPDIEEQKKIVEKLDSMIELVRLQKDQIEQLDTLIKSRFVEMFGDPVRNDKQFGTIIGENFFKLSNGKAVPEEKRKSAGIPAYGGNGISWYTNDTLVEKDTLVVGRVGFQSGNVHLAYGPLWVTDNAMYISEFHVEEYDLVFLSALMEHINFMRFQDAGDLKKITQKPFMQMEFIFPPMEMQHQYSAFVRQIDKLKFPYAS